MGLEVPFAPYLLVFLFVSLSLSLFLSSRSSFVSVI